MPGKVIDCHSYWETADSPGHVGLLLHCFFGGPTVVFLVSAPLELVYACYGPAI